MKQHSWNDYYEPEMSDFIGRTFSRVKSTGDELIFTCDDGVFTFYHEQSCCEGVYIESIVGDLSDLVGYPILKAEEATSSTNPADAKAEIIEYQDSFTWTFYKFATIKGYVDIRWYGSSNGYYSEGVDLKFEPSKTFKPNEP